MFWESELAEIVEGALQDDEEVADDDPVPEMELQPYEHYDYVVLVFRNSWDFSRAVDALGVKREGLTTFDQKGRKSSRKVGLCRVLDGAQFVERICESSSPAEGE
jgi:hypothetical protein